MSNNISDLIKEAKPYYFKKKRQKQVLSSVGTMCATFFVVFSLTFNANEFSYNQEDIDEIAYGSVIENYGFDVDEYGLLEV